MIRIGDTVRICHNNKESSTLRSKYIGLEGIVVSKNKNKIKIDLFDKQMQNNKLVWKKSELEKVYYKYGRPVSKINRSKLISNGNIGDRSNWVDKS